MNKLASLAAVAALTLIAFSIPVAAEASDPIELGSGTCIGHSTTDRQGHTECVGVCRGPMNPGDTCIGVQI